MSYIELILIGVGLAMDACCVCVSNGIRVKKMTLKAAFAQSLMFGFFQGIMPVIGYFAGSFLVDFSTRYSKWIVGGVFLVLACKTMWDAFSNGEEVADDQITKKMLVTQGIATSIDALAVGVVFGTLAIHIGVAALIIGLATFLLCLLALFLGKYAGKQFSKHAGILGGTLLLLLALKSLVFE